MRVFKYILAGAVAVSTMVATSAIAAGPTRSAVALPSAQYAPVNGVRTATTLQRASSQSDGDSPALGYVLAGVFAVGLVAATIAATDNNSKTGPDSAG